MVFAITLVTVVCSIPPCSCFPCLSSYLLSGWILLICFFYVHPLSISPPNLQVVLLPSYFSPPPPMLSSPSLNPITDPIKHGEGHSRRSVTEVRREKRGGEGGRAERVERLWESFAGKSQRGTESQNNCCQPARTNTVNCPNFTWNLNKLWQPRRQWGWSGGSTSSLPRAHCPRWRYEERSIPPSGKEAGGEPCMQS